MKFLTFFLVQKKTFNNTCDGNYQCNDNVGLLCTNLNCVCNSSQYWSQSVSQCKNLKTFNQSCLAQFECNSTAGLFCSGSKCTCAINYYWSNVSKNCRKYLFEK